MVIVGGGSFLGELWIDYKLENAVFVDIFLRYYQ